MDRVFASGIIPVSVIDDASHSVPLGDALLAGGINVVEVTFRTDAAAESIQRIREALPDILVGAGTIVNLDQCKRAVDSGASFIVSPGFSEEIVSWCCLHNIPVFPGCVTPSEIMKAMAYGLSVLKFFPANIYGGLPALGRGNPYGELFNLKTGMGIGVKESITIQFRDMIRGIIDNEPQEPSFYDGLKAAEISSAIIQSSDIHSWVKVDCCNKGCRK